MTSLQAAYNAALKKPFEAVIAVGLTRSSSRKEIFEVFTKIYQHFEPSGLESDVGRRRLHDAVDLFYNDEQIPEFVARYCAGIATDEIIHVAA